MKYKSLFVLLLIICISLFIPKEVFAFYVYNNVNIDYRFFVDEDKSNAGKLKFKLYDKSGTLNFESQYDSSTKQYYFKYDKNAFHKESEYHSYDDYYSYSWIVDDWSLHEDGFRDYVLYGDEFYQINNYEFNSRQSEFLNFLSLHNLNGSYDETDPWSTYTYYSYIPLILENVDTGVKKICLASINVRNELDEYVHLFFVNNTVKRKEENTTLVDSFLDNVDFMRKTSLDYSDELW